MLGLLEVIKVSKEKTASFPSVIAEEQCRCPLPSENKQEGRKSVSSTGQRVPDELLAGLCLTGTAGEVSLNRLRCMGPVLSTK